MSYFVIPDALCNNNLSHLLIKLFCCIWQYEICQKSNKNILIYYIGNVTIKDSKYLKIHNVNRLYLVFSKVFGYLEETNKNIRRSFLLIKAKE